ncbi:MAG: AAA family ATPase, partial [Chloroflexi bacterium]|nr:AAA family ATPase [Chloroflexota bacterium]
ESGPPDVSLFTGGFLQGFDLRDAPLWEEWLQTRRETLQTRALLAMEAQGARLAAGGDYPLAAQYYLCALSMDLWREAAHQGLMRVYALSGDRAAALAQYERCRAALAEGLGVEPLPETQALYRQILEGLPLPAGGRRPVAPLLPFVGRSNAHALLVADWQECRGGARLTLVEGEAGLGKTRLVEEVLRQVALRQARVACGQCVEFAAEVPYRPIVEALRSLLNGSPAFLSSLSPIWLAELTRLLPELRERYPDLPQPRSGEGEAARQRLFEAATRYVRAAGENPLSVSGAALVFFLDDLHWADRATLDLLHHLVHALASAPLPSGAGDVWFVGTVRPEETQLSDALTRMRQNLAHEGLARLLPLTPLSDGAVHQIAASLSDDPALASFLVSESGGNPFILSEVVKELQETGRLQPTPAGRWVVAGNLTSEMVPERVEELALQRVGRLPELARQWLNFAVVIGEPFAPDLLAEMVGEQQPALPPVLQAWQARRLLQPDAAGRYDFVHDKIRAAIYHYLAPDLRKLCHERVGQALLDRAVGYAVGPSGSWGPGLPSGAVPDEVAAQVAYHFERSFNPRHVALSERNTAVLEHYGKRASSCGRLASPGQRPARSPEQPLRSQP